MANTGVAINLQRAERAQLRQWEASHGTPQQVALRCRIILGALAGQNNVSIAEKLEVSRPMVQLWRKRVSERGIGEVWQIAPGRGRKAQYDQGKREAIIEATLQSKPAGMTHWSCRLMAEAQEVSKSTVNRLWQLHNIKPHLSGTFKLSRDAKFLEKLTDVVGLYMNPPDKALVLCLDEKSQIQALDRTQPGLPLKKGRCGTMTHDYKRNGTTTLFAALNVLDGKVIGECHGRHRHQEWLKFLRRLDGEFPAELKLHLVMDNYGTHKEPHVQAWLKRHPRFVCHFVPTSSSWLNLVERWFRELTEKAIRRGSFLSVPDLKQAIDDFMRAWNHNPKPFIWTASVGQIIEKIDRARTKMEQIKPGSTLPRAKRKADKL
ncbi:MAG TPA: IS630 family transposase [Candidatus Acidoferrum sp.]|nr:IS630 family transposase [Candidatus Acidoferrum sp.]